MNDYTDEDLKNIIESLTPNQFNVLYEIVINKKRKLSNNCCNTHTKRFIRNVLSNEKLLKDLVASNDTLANKFSIDSNDNKTDDILNIKSYILNNFSINSDDAIIQMFSFILFTYYTLVMILGENFIDNNKNIINEVARYSQKTNSDLIYFVPDNIRINLSEKLLLNGMTIKLVFYCHNTAPSIRSLSVFRDKTNKIKAYLINNDVTEFYDLSSNFQEFVTKIQKDELSVYSKYKKYKNLLKSIKNSLVNDVIKFRKRDKSLITRQVKNKKTGDFENEKFKPCSFCNKHERNPINQKTSLCFHCFILYLYLCENGIISKRDFMRLSNNNDIRKINSYIENYRDINRKARFKIPEEQFRVLADTIEQNIKEFSKTSL